MIFRNEIALKADFLPDTLPGREAQVNEIVFALQPAFEGRKAKNLFLWGPPGTGKTSCAKFVFRKLGEESQKARTVFVNCWQNPTRNSVLARIAEAIGEPLPRRGLGSDEMFERISENFLSQKSVGVIALDECDRLLHNKEDAIVYDLLRREFVSAVVCVTNDLSFLQKIDERARSSLQPEVLVFKRYSPMLLKKILFERASLSFKPNACPPEVIAVVAAYASKLGGDARVALEALWQCGKNAEARGSQKIEKKDFEMLKENPSVAKKLEGLGAAEREIIGVLEKQKGKSILAGELYAKVGLPERTVRNHLNLLESKKIVSIQTVVLKLGRTSRITLEV
ncbi:MAG: AAA family ATPase [Candidatus Micrarchaeota archaeon]